MMPHSFGLVYVHLVLGTRDSRTFPADTGLRADLHGYMTGILGNLGCQSLRIGGGEDHVHVLLRLSREASITRVVEELWRGSSVWLLGREVEDFGWSRDFGAFSVTDQQVDRVIRYVANDERRHHTMTFGEEYRGFLQRCAGRDHEVNVHYVFSTKNRIPFLADEELRQRLYDWLAESCETLDSPSLAVGGIEDHVHILCRLAPDQTLARLAREIKKRSSTWLSTHQRIEGFRWQEGYGVFSVSPEQVTVVTRYIENQQEHHRSETFQDECRRFAGNPTARGKAWRTPGNDAQALGKPHSPG